MTEKRRIHDESGLLNEQVLINFNSGNHEHVVKGLRISEKTVEEVTRGYDTGEIVLDVGDTISTIVVLKDSMGDKGFPINTVLRVSNKLVTHLDDSIEDK